ncbi:MAG: iron-sulfur cluster assembly protein [Halobacteriales archaeon]
MSDQQTAEEIEDAIADVTHPEIDATLVELGMIDDVRVEDGEPSIDVAIPMADIPDAIKKMLAGRLFERLQPLGVEPSIRFVVMDARTRERFFQMEQDNWKGLEGQDDGPPEPPTGDGGGGNDAPF